VKFRKNDAIFQITPFWDRLYLEPVPTLDYKGSTRAGEDFLNAMEGIFALHGAKRCAIINFQQKT